MTLIEKITKEMVACEKEIAECDTKIKIAETERICYKNQLQMLTELLEKAKNENADTTIPEQKPAKPARKKKPASDTTDDNANPTPDEPTPAASATISMKTLSEELGVTTTVVAQTCTNLGYNDEMAKNNYFLTAEQAEKVRKLLTV